MSTAFRKPRGCHVDNSIKITEWRRPPWGWLKEADCAASRCVFCPLFSASLGLICKQAGGHKYRPSNTVWWKEPTWFIYYMLEVLQIRKHKGSGDTRDFSKQDMLISPMNGLFPSCWCVFLCSHLSWLLPKKLILLTQILQLLVPFNSLDKGCPLFYGVPWSSGFAADGFCWH